MWPCIYGDSGSGCHKTVRSYPRREISCNNSGLSQEITGSHPSPLTYLADTSHSGIRSPERYGLQVLKFFPGQRMERAFKGIIQCIRNLSGGEESTSGIKNKKKNWRRKNTLPSFPTAEKLRPSWKKGRASPFLLFPFAAGEGESSLRLPHIHLAKACPYRLNPRL